MKGDLLYLSNILECLNKIERYTETGKDRFLKESMIQDAVIRNFEIIGEAIGKLSDRIVLRTPHIP